MPGSLPSQTIDCELTESSLVNQDVYRLLLRVPDGQAARFYAGQYLEIIFADGQRCAFSIGSSPAHTRNTGVIELHFRHVSGHPPSESLLATLRSATRLQVELPMGGCYLEQVPASPVLLIAGSTGFSQAKSIIEFLLDHDTCPEIFLYWGGRTVDDLYLDGLPRQWAATHTNFIYHPVVSAPDAEVPYGGRPGLVHEAVLSDFDDLSGHLVIASGSPAMVYAAYDAFIDKGVSRDNFHSDVFDYAPR